MAKRKAAKKRKVARGRKAGKAARKIRAGKRAARPKKRRHARGKTVQPRVWRRAARLAQDALAALEAGNLDEVRECLEAIYAVAHCADEQ